MSITTTGQHPIRIFNTPVHNGRDTIDPDAVRGNDNTIRKQYTAHDDDGSMHLLGDATTYVSSFLLMGG